MATQVQFRGGTTTEHASFNGVAKEVTVDTTKQTLVVQDGSTNGGFPLLREKNPDGAKAYFGDNNELEIYHSTQNRIDSKTTQLRLISDALRLRSSTDSHTFAECDHNGAFKIYHAGGSNPSIETTSTGSKVTGNLEVSAAATGGIDLPNINTWITGGGHNVVQVDATKTYFYGGSAGIQFRDSANAGSLIEVTDTGQITATPAANSGNNALTITPAGGTTASSFRVLGNNNTSSRNGGVVYIDANYFNATSDVLNIKGRGTQLFNLTGEGTATFAGDIKLAASKGIQFSNYGAEEDPDVAATDVTGNTLSDYEEGAFTPELGTVNTANTHTETTAFGNYTKIGRTVFCQLNVVWSNYSTPGDSGNAANLHLVIRNLPFTAADSSNTTSGMAIAEATNMGYGTSGLGGNVPANTNTIKLKYRDSNGTHGIAIGGTQTSGSLAMSFFYDV